MTFQFRRGHTDPCPLPTRGDSLGATAIGEIGRVFVCTCGRTWQIHEYCLYCVDVKISHNYHSIMPYWVTIDDRVRISWFVALGLTFTTSMVGLTLLILASAGKF